MSHIAFLATIIGEARTGSTRIQRPLMNFMFRPSRLRSPRSGQKLPEAEAREQENANATATLIARIIKQIRTPGSAPASARAFRCA